jgi:ATP-dependent DNA ligase
MPSIPEPQLSELSRHLPSGEGWLYEPKWDGFRGMLARLPAGTRLLSRRMRELGPHYPELLELGPLLPPDSVLDGEIVAFVAGGLDFSALQHRLTIGEGAARSAAQQLPVSFVAFDVLRLEGQDLTGKPLVERRAVLESLLAGLAARPLLELTPQTDDRDAATAWLTGFLSAGIEGVVAKQVAGRYRPGERSWIKVKGERPLLTVVMGYVGALDQPRLVLGLYDGDGVLHVLGSSYPLRPQDVPPLRRLEPVGWRPEPPLLHRWQGQLAQGWTELPPALVAEVTVTHLDHGRIRHSARFRRWRPDLAPASCTLGQVSEQALESGVRSES